jgi:hypothetical protein
VPIAPPTGVSSTDNGAVTPVYLVSSMITFGFSPQPPC